MYLQFYFNGILSTLGTSSSSHTNGITAEMESSVACRDGNGGDGGGGLLPLFSFAIVLAINDRPAGWLPGWMAVLYLLQYLKNEFYSSRHCL